MQTATKSKEWHERRRQGIGGSDAAAIAGLNPWKSAVAVWLEKTGQSEQQEAGESAYWGIILEDIVAKEFSIQTGKKTMRKNKTLQHREYPFMIANVDRMIVGKNEGLECKTTGEYMAKQWKDNKIPDMYMLQIQHYMAVTNTNAWWLAVLIGGNKFKYQRVERNQEIINYLIEIEKDFWNNYVLPKQMPPLDGTSASVEVLNLLYPESEYGKQIELPPSTQGLLYDYTHAKEQEKIWTEKKDGFANKIKQLMGDAETAFIGERKISWKTIKSERLDSKRLKKEMPEIYKEYIKENISRRFEV